MSKIRKIVIVLTVVFCLGLSLPVQAAEKLQVQVNQSSVLAFSGVERVAVANPEIADVMVISGNEVILVGKAVGITSLHIWSWQGRSSYVVEVGDETYTADDIQKVLGYPNVKVKKVGQTILLEGWVVDQYQRNRAEKLATSYSNKVVNLIEMSSPVQIKIEAKIIEIDRQKSQDLGIKWGSGGYIGDFLVGQSFGNPNGGGNPFGKLGGYEAINGQVSALIKNGVAKVLSQPHMITLSGEKANIIVGGQIPVPVSVQGNQIGIEWKDYGIKLQISPEVDAKGLINSKVKASVSSLDWNSPHEIQLGPNMNIPPIKLREAESVIALASGQTMVIGGLISNEMTKDLFKVPLLGDLPILGSLFKSTSFNKNETELLILITPTLVNVENNQLEAKQELSKFNKQDPSEGLK